MPRWNEDDGRMTSLANQPCQMNFQNVVESISRTRGGERNGMAKWLVARLAQREVCFGCCLMAVLYYSLIDNRREEGSTDHDGESKE